jgi:hypothetical protein
MASGVTEGNPQGHPRARQPLLSAIVSILWSGLPLLTGMALADAVSKTRAPTRPRWLMCITQKPPTAGGVAIAAKVSVILIAPAEGLSNRFLST